MSDDGFETSDPRDPPSGTPVPDGQRIEPPGVTTELDPMPDHGEETYVGSNKLAGRRALITGGDSGIGRAVAIAFAREGADVVISHLRAESEDAATTVEAIRAAGRTGTAIEADLSDVDTCRRLVSSAVDALGGLDLVVNNAAHQMAVDSFEELSPEQLVHTFTVNVFATYWICQAALEHLDVGSSIINTTSIQASQPSRQLVDYAATKAALVNFTANLGAELAERGIRVNSVAPGPFWTPLIPATMPADKVDGFGTDTPLGRPGQPAEIAAAFVFMACDDARYVTGETLHVTGGRIG